MATYLNYTMCGMGDGAVGLLVIEQVTHCPGINGRRDPWLG